MSVSVEEVKAFIKEADKGRDDWLRIASRSWAEIKRRQSGQKLWSPTPNSVKRANRYPAWYSIFKIRQPLLLSRIGIPIGKDTTQDGSDSIGALAAVLKERLAKNIVKPFDFFDVLCTARDDFLVTNVGTLRAYYQKKDVKQKVKEYLTVEELPDGEGQVLADGEGNIIDPDEAKQDDEGYFIEHDEVVDVTDEQICLEQVLYRDWYVDPRIKRYGRCRRMAFGLWYSRDEYVEIFGSSALQALPSQDAEQDSDEAAPKNQDIEVLEYWDDYTKEVLWLPKNGSAFITPKKYNAPDVDDEGEGDDLNGLYNLDGFFPCPKPLIMNQATDEFWPVPEFFQVMQITEDIHTLFSRMMALTRAIRARLLFDNNVEGLQEALNEASEGDAFGVPNLAQSLASAGGSLDAVVQYIPVEQLINGLAQLYTALEQRLNTLYKLTGTSDLLQGLITDPTQRTFGERQMTEKYALNQLAEPQRKMAEFVRDCYELACEMAIKNFKEETLDRYIIPQTLSPEQQRNYRAALGMLKDNHKRFRIELETDSTIALNEQYDKEMRVELVNALTSAIEKTAQIAGEAPELAAIHLHALKFLIQGFRQAKLFQAEITEAIDQAIENVQTQEPPPNMEAQKLALEQQKLNTTVQLKQMEIVSGERVETAKLQQEGQLEVLKLQQEATVSALKNQLDEFKAQVDAGSANGDLQLRYEELIAKINEAQSKIALDREALTVEVQKVAGDQRAKEFSMMMEAQMQPYTNQLEAQEQEIEKLRLIMQNKQLAVTDAHVQADNVLEERRLSLQEADLMHEMRKPPEMPDITINMPEQVSTKKKIKVTRDALGNVKTLSAEDSKRPVKSKK